jgi:hypothetical protein
LTFKHFTQILFAVFLFIVNANAQENYEIQVYGSDTQEKRTTMFELHSNFTFEGSKVTTDGTYPTNHALHETLEITQGFNDWFETGFYIFTSAREGQGWQWVGSHVRPRFRVPEKWHWPVGLSLSQEFGYVRAKFSPDTWTWEIRPIIDKQMGRWYVAFNPALERSWHGPSVNQGVVFSPGARVTFDVTKKIALGTEYYGSLGPVTGFDPLREQQQQLFFTVDLNVSPKWEINFGPGVGMTQATDHFILKCIIGRRFSWGRKKENQPVPVSANK